MAHLVRGSHELDTPARQATSEAEGVLPHLAPATILVAMGLDVAAEAASAPLGATPDLGHNSSHIDMDITPIHGNYSPLPPEV